MPALSRIASWSDLPHRSNIEISLSGTTVHALVTGHVFSLRDDGIEQQFPDAAVQPGPLVIPFDPGHSYSILVDLVYTTAATATVDAVVQAPRVGVIPEDGAPPDKFHSVITGSINQVNGVTFFITTKP